MRERGFIMYDLSNLSDKQKRKLLWYYKGYAYIPVRNRTIILFLLELKCTADEVASLKNSGIPFIPMQLKKQLKQWLKIRRICFYGKEFSEYLFLNTHGKQMTSKQIHFIVQAALKFIGINPNDKQGRVASC